MEQKSLGYVKVYRQLLESDVHNASFAARACFIDILLLLDRKTGVLNTSVTDLTRILGIKERKTTYKVLRELESYEVIKITWTKPLEIAVPGWAFYQRIKRVEKPIKEQKTESESVYKIHTGQASKVCKKDTPSVYKIHRDVYKIHNECVKNTQQCVKNTHSPYAYKQEVLTRNKQEFLQEEANLKNANSKPEDFYNFSDPKTDLEKFVNFYLKGIESPLLEKENKVIVKALKNDIPHFDSILAKTKNINQAKRILQNFVSSAKGKFSVYYLAQQIDSWRQEDEDKNYGKI